VQCDLEDGVKARVRVHVGVDDREEGGDAILDDLKVGAEEEEGVRSGVSPHVKVLSEDTPLDARVPVGWDGMGWDGMGWDGM
jgi:hypothetical protein